MTVPCQTPDKAAERHALMSFNSQAALKPKEAGIGGGTYPHSPPPWFVK